MISGPMKTALNRDDLPASGASDSGDDRLILGIDPGYRCTGYGLLRCRYTHLSYVDSGHIDSTKGSTGDRLAAIYSGLCGVVTRYQPDLVTIEEVFINRNPASSLKLGQARGVAFAAVTGAGLPVFEYAATTVKQCITGVGRASKQQVQYMVGQLLGIAASTMNVDETDALAVALCHVHQQSPFPAVRSRSRRRSLSMWRR